MRDERREREQNGAKSSSIWRSNYVIDDPLPYLMFPYQNSDLKINIQLL